MSENESNASHTPGPYRVKKYSIGYGVFDDKGDVVQAAGASSVKSTAVHHAKIMNIAHERSAAPDLLNALEAAIQHLPDPGGMAAGSSAAQAHIDARAAIAKARGEAVPSA